MTGMLIVSIADLLYAIPDNFGAATKIIRIKLLFTRKNSAFDQRDFCDGSKMHHADPPPSPLPPPVNKQEQGLKCAACIGPLLLILQRINFHVST